MGRRYGYSCQRPKTSRETGPSMPTINYPFALTLHWSNPILYSPYCYQFPLVSITHPCTKGQLQQPINLFFEEILKVLTTSLSLMSSLMFLAINGWREKGKIRLFYPLQFRYSSQILCQQLPARHSLQ